MATAVFRFSLVAVLRSVSRHLGRESRLPLKLPADRTSRPSLMHAPIVQAHHLCRSAGAVKLLDDVSLTVSAGERIALVGPSGSGKSLLLRALVLLDPIDSGELRWFGEHVQDRAIPSVRSRIIYLQQRPALIEATVEENLRQPYRLATHAHKRFDRSRIVAWLRMLGRSDTFLDKQHSELSGGEAQLTALLRAVQLAPEMLLLDEPTSALDTASSRMVETLVESWLAEAPQLRAALWVTHDHDQALRVSATLRHIEAGRLNNVPLSGES